MAKFEFGKEYKMVKTRKATEDMILASTVEELRTWIEEIGEFEDEDYFYNLGKCKVYAVNMNDEFIITEDGRVFYWLSVVEKIEVVDSELKLKSI